MSKVATDLLLDIASEKNGYSIGKPWRFSEFSLAAVVPILRPTDIEERGYRLISEVKDVRIKDTGSINQVELTNKSGLAVLVKAGEVVTGATQSRALSQSQVLMPGEKVMAECVCVHASEGIRAGQQVNIGSYSPSKVRRTVYKGYDINRFGDAPDDIGVNFNYTGGLQSQVWGSVRETSENYVRGVNCFAASAGGLGADIDPQTYHTPQDDLAGRMNEFGDKLKDVLKDIPKFDDQVGLCLLTLSGLESLDTFNHPKSWDAFHKAVLKSESGKIADVSDQDNVFEFREDKAKSIIRELLTTKYDESITINKDRTQTILLNGKKLIGELVILDDKPIHCSFVRKS